MQEKIKISLPKATLELIEKDAVDFKFKKADGSVNLNSFVNTLISNYYLDFSHREENFNRELQRILESVPERYREDAFMGVSHLVSHSGDYDYDKRNSTTFSFKPTKASSAAVRYIEHILLESESLSSFYRRMFICYSKKAKNERELIIFKETYEAICRQIEKGEELTIILKNSAVYQHLSPFAVAGSRDELFNYLLAYDGKTNRTIRLAQIDTVLPLLSRADIPEEFAALFERQIECGVQYPMYRTDREPIKVRLTDKGVDMFNRIYLYRPVPVSIEGDIYTFNCSRNQALHYFQRFGSSALIISPRKLGQDMRNFYSFASRAYRKEYND